MHARAPAAAGLHSLAALAVLAGPGLSQGPPRPPELPRRLPGRPPHHLLPPGRALFPAFLQSSSAAAKQRIAVAVSLLTTPETPGARALALVYLEKRALDILLGVLTDPHASEEAQRQAARALMRAADNCGASAPINADPEPPEPKARAARG